METESGFLFLAALLYYVDREGLFLWMALFCTLHELGHWLAIRLMGGRVAGLRLSCTGAELTLAADRPLSPAGMAVAALAGPGVNLALALGCAALGARGTGERLYLMAGMNLALAAFNLLPVRWLDGGRALEAVLELLGRDGRALTAWTSLAVAAAALAGGLVLLEASGGRNFSLLLMGLWLLLMSLGERREKVGGNLKKHLASGELLW